MLSLLFQIGIRLKVSKNYVLVHILNLTIPFKKKDKISYLIKKIILVT